MPDFAPDLLHRLVWELDRGADQLLRAQLGIPFARAIFLFTLERGGTLSQHELAVALGYSDPAVSTMVSALGREGLVTTAPSPEHGRKRMVSITAEGRTIVRKGRALLARDFQALMKAADVDHEQYGTLTTRLLNALLAKTERTRAGGSGAKRGAIT